MTKGVALLLACLAMWGCQGNEAVQPEPEVSKQAAQDAQSNWSPEQVEAFQKAHQRARSGEEGK